MKLVIVNIVSAHAPQVSLSAKEKYGSFIIRSYLNSHVGRNADVYGGVHGGMGFGTRNAEGERILDYGDAVAVCNL